MSTITEQSTCTHWVSFFFHCISQGVVQYRYCTTPWYQPAIQTCIDLYNHTGGVKRGHCKHVTPSLCCFLVLVDHSLQSSDTRSCSAVRRDLGPVMNDHLGVKTGVFSVDLHSLHDGVVAFKKHNPNLCIQKDNVTKNRLTWSKKLKTIVRSSSCAFRGIVM